MDKRTQLAFILVALVLGVNMLIMARLSPKRPPVSKAADSTAAAVADSSLAARPLAATTGAVDTTRPTSSSAGENGGHVVGAGAAPAMFAAADAASPQIVVRTPLYEVHLKPNMMSS